MNYSQFSKIYRKSWIADKLWLWFIAFSEYKFSINLKKSRNKIQISGLILIYWLPTGVRQIITVYKGFHWYKRRALTG